MELLCVSSRGVTVVLMMGLLFSPYGLVVHRPYLCTGSGLEVVATESYMKHYV